jgi:hypothetical protein
MVVMILWVLHNKYLIEKAGGVSYDIKKNPGTSDSDIFAVFFYQCTCRKTRTGKRTSGSFSGKYVYFDKTLEGTQVIHDFVIKNNGKCPSDC